MVIDAESYDHRDLNLATSTTEDRWMNLSNISLLLCSILFNSSMNVVFWALLAERPSRLEMAGFYDLATIQIARTRISKSERQWV